MIYFIFRSLSKNKMINCLFSASTYLFSACLLTSFRYITYCIFTCHFKLTKKAITMKKQTGNDSSLFYNLKELKVDESRKTVITKISTTKIILLNFCLPVLSLVNRLLFERIMKKVISYSKRKSILI